MKPPFELPAKIHKIGTLARGEDVLDVVDDKGNYLMCTNENLPYIVQAINSHEDLLEEQKRFRHKCTCKSQKSPYKCTCEQGIEGDLFYYMHKYENDKCIWCGWEPDKAFKGES